VVVGSKGEVAIKPCFSLISLMMTQKTLYFSQLISEKGLRPSGFMKKYPYSSNKHIERWVRTG